MFSQTDHPFFTYPSEYHLWPYIPIKTRFLLTEILRNQWGFDGLVVADYAGISLLHTHYGIAGDTAEAVALAFNARLDIEWSGPTADDQLAMFSGYSFPVHLIAANMQEALELLTWTLREESVLLWLGFLKGPGYSPFPNLQKPTLSIRPCAIGCFCFKWPCQFSLRCAGFQQNRSIIHGFFLFIHYKGFWRAKFHG
jgi:glycosyl hydrolase family 3